MNWKLDRTERWIIALILTVLLVPVYVVFVALTSITDDAYTPPCRTVGHVQIPESECGR